MMFLRIPEANLETLSENGTEWVPFRVPILNLTKRRGRKRREKVAKDIVAGVVYIHGNAPPGASGSR